MGTDARLVSPDAATWSGVLDAVAHDVYHLPGYASLEAQRTDACPRAFVYREGTRVMLLPLLVHGVPDTDLADAVSPYGYSGPVSNVEVSDVDFWRRAVRAMVATLAAERIITVFVRLHPLLPVPYEGLRGAGVLVRHGETVSMDLRLPHAEIWAQVRRSHRRAINQARRRGMRVVIDDWDYLKPFIEVYHDTMRRVGASDGYLFEVGYFNGLRDALGERLHLAVALADDEVVGGSLFFSYLGLAHAHLAGTRTGDGARGAGKLIDDELWRWVRARGGTAYHLGGGIGGERGPLFDYKRGFSDRTHPFFTWRVVVDPVAYAAVLHRHAPHDERTDLTGFFPAYRRGSSGPPPVANHPSR